MNVGKSYRFSPPGYERSGRATHAGQLTHPHAPLLLVVSLPQFGLERCLLREYICDRVRVRLRRIVRDLRDAVGLAHLRTLDTVDLLRGPLDCLRARCAKHA